jgi:pyrroline-5-carboxylate reductase
MKKSAITFIGGGNMSASLIGGLLRTGVLPNNIRVSDPQATPLAFQFPICRYTDNIQAIAETDVVVLAVKPQVLGEVAKSIAGALTTNRLPLFITIAAGVRIEDLSRWLGGGYQLPIPIVRVMPNTPALVQSAASALFAGQHVTQVQRELAESILRAVGLTVWLEDEHLMDVVTALSGSGPAYFFFLMEILEKIGIDLGLSPETARLLTLQTAFGAAKMALESPENTATLRARVTSKGGTTEQAINTLKEGQLEALFNQALQAAQQRAVALAQQLGELS